MDETHHRSKYGPNRDIDPKRACALCGRPGLHWKNTTGKCATCFRRLPTVAKVSCTTEAKGILQRFAKQLVEHHGLAASAQMLALDPQTTLAVTRGEICIVPAGERPPGAQDPSGLEVSREPARQLTATDLGLPKEHPLAGVQLDPDLLADVVRRYRDVQPLDPTLAGVIAPWRRAMRVEAAKEEPGQRIRRLNRAKAREAIARYVPPPDAPLDPTQPVNAYGCDPSASHLPRHKLPLRVAVGLWGLGFGSGGIVKIADRARQPVSKSVVHRLVERAKYKFAGAEAVKLGELAGELSRRPSGARG